MAYQSAEFDKAMAHAAGDDPALLAELRLAFAESAARQLDLLRRARCDANWHVAAERLHAVAASFHAAELMELASEARDAVPNEPTVLRRIAAVVDTLD